ncbi:monovalent cation/H+ antiporter subunit A [Xylophilus rhododendri]|uniref:Monovalent cation/H+ antiporter subunit A n=1 Tax=Xylophilus rhododendri TaxID=2697032 RepID=A0A857J7V4_9BURK|nr:monovalent cation/H+ antiporter subunit A [Xylophilus rhododendri]QHI99946.1 monovalent cation/H+ antiporter subunit A [Xylophilus rhododendri]
MLLTALLVLPFLGSLAAALLPTRARNTGALLAGAIALVGTGLTVSTFPALLQAVGSTALQTRIDWMPSIGLSFSLRLDGMAWLFCLLIYAMGALVALYARYYLSPKDPVPRFYAFMLAFMGSMVGVVLAGHLVVLAFFWELTSFFSFLLIGYWYHRRDARCGARNALLVTGTGGLCLLAGLLLMGHIAGGYDMDTVLAAGDRLRAHPLYLPMLVLVLLGALTKSAQFPFHFWLPQAMAAPTPVSAYLHSATLVKAGVFLLARFWPVLSGTDAWFWMVGGAGLATLLIGAWAALFQNDLKGLLAYSTLSHLGLITLLFGLNSNTAAVAGVFHILNHATFKASLFMAAGIVDHESGTRDIRKLSGLWRLMPITGTLAIVASASMAGVPLLNGFLSKEMFFAETTFVTATPWVEWLLPVAATLAGALSVAYALRFVFDVFFGPKAALKSPKTPHEPVRWMRLPIELLVLACLVVGVAPQGSIGHILDVAARPVLGGEVPEYSLAIWHGFNLPLMMSLAAFAGGIALYFLRPWLAHGASDHVPIIGRLSGQRALHWLLVQLARKSRDLRLLLDTHRLQPQLRWLLGAALIGGTWAMSTYLPAGPARATLPVDPAFALLWTIGGICAIGTAWAARRRRLAALTLSGGTGLCCCLTFVWCSAPDLALTQLTVEIATTVLLLLALRWLPRPPARPIEMHAGRQLRRLRDLLLALGIGAGLSALAWWTMTRPLTHSVSDFYLKNSQSEAGGANVVNVMLVDFRGFDTFGESVVLAIVALTVYALLRRFRPARAALALPAQQRELPETSTDLVNPRHVHDTAVGYLTIPAVLVRLLLPLAAAVAAWLFLRGHNAPGGGFVAALVLAIAILLQYLVSGTQWVDARVGLRPRRWIATGMLLLLATGAGAWVWGYPFLTSHTVHLPWPGPDGVHLPSAFFFDLGVFAVVVGTTLMMLTSVAHQSVRAHRASARGGEEDKPRRHGQAAEAATAAQGND